MSTDATILPIITLAIFSSGGLLIAAHIARHLGRLLNFRSLVIVMYVMVNMVSGIVHLSSLPGSTRGFHDVLENVEAGFQGKLFAVVVTSVVGLVALCAASLSKLPAKREAHVALAINPPRSLSGRERRFLLGASAVLLPVTLLALSQLNAYADSLDSRRIIGLNDGMARIGFLSHWFTWVVSFVTIWLAATHAGRTQFRKLLLVVGAVMLIVSSLEWTGGRSIAVLMALPIVIIFLPQIRRYRVFLTLALTIAAIVYSVTLTDTRTKGFSNSGFNLANVLDWEWGRFSMMGFALDYVEGHGHIYGESFLAAISSVPLGILSFLGWADDLWQPRTITEISGREILGSGQLTYIVPGLSAELYINFGLIGIVVGYFLLGKATNWVDDHFGLAEGVLSRFALAYLGVILILRTIPAESGAFFGYAIFSGLPVLVAWAFSERRACQRP